MGFSPNEFDFVLKGSAGNKIDFKWNGEYSIGNTKNWGGVDVYPGSDKVHIVVHANRDGTGGPATWYKEYVGYVTSHMIHTEGGDNAPGKLNFAIKGTLMIGEHSYAICLGQGHGAANNWHLCSESVDADENNKNGFLMAAAAPGRTRDQQYYLTQDGVNKFGVHGVSDSCDSSDFFLDVDGELEQLSFAQTDFKVSAHQPYVGVESSFQGNMGKIVVKAGKHKTEEVKNWFREQISGGEAIGCASKSNSPHELNFAIKGVLKYKIKGEKAAVTVEDFMLAQGSWMHGVENNWWLGGPRMYGLSLDVAGGAIAQRISLLPLRQTQWSSVVSLPPKTNQMTMKIDTLAR